MSEIKATFGERLADLRVELGITQKELGDNVGVASSTIGTYENNIGFPEIKTLINLSNYFNVSIDYLLCTTEHKHRWEGFEKEYDSGITLGYVKDSLDGFDAEKLFLLKEYIEYLKNK